MPVRADFHKSSRAARGSIWTGGIIQMEGVPSFRASGPEKRGKRANGLTPLCSRPAGCLITMKKSVSLGGPETRPRTRSMVPE
jgi:hypothetical protein